MEETHLEKCPRCFAELKEPWQFCPSCGLPLDPALTSDSEITSPNISYVNRPKASAPDRRRSRRESIVQSGLNILVVLACVGILAGGVLVLSPDLLGRLLATTKASNPEPIGRAPDSPPDVGTPTSVDEIEWAVVDGAPTPYGGAVPTGNPETWKKKDPDDIPRTPEMPAFRISRYEITNYQYFEYLVDTLRDVYVPEEESGERKASWGRSGPTSHWRDLDWLELNPKPDTSQMEEPVRGVTFNEAQDFCRWLSQRLRARIRLPYWFEWEKAARGPDGWIYPWGDTFDARRCHINGPGPVSGLHYGGPLRENEDDLRDISYFKVFNMAGNVSEWVDSGAARTKYIMGGDYASVDKYHTYTWARIPFPPTFRAQFVGFRVVREYD